MNNEAKIVWSWEDIKSIQENWSQAECEAFMAEYARDIEERSMELGWEIIRDLISIKQWKEDKQNG